MPSLLSPRVQASASGKVGVDFRRGSADESKRLPREDEAKWNQICNKTQNCSDLCSGGGCLCCVAALQWGHGGSFEYETYRRAVQEAATMGSKWICKGREDDRAALGPWCPLMTSAEAFRHFFPVSLPMSNSTLAPVFKIHWCERRKDEL